MISQMYIFNLVGSQHFLIRKKAECRIYAFVLLFLAVLVLNSCTGKTEIFVSAKGNDKNSGAKEQPVATLTQAVEIVKKKKAENATIFFRDGIYEIKTTVVLKDVPKGLTITAYQDEKAYLTGGRKIKGFVPLDKRSEAYDRLEEKSRANVMQIDLKSLGINDYPTIKPRGFGRDIIPSGLTLFFNGEPMTIARWPNDSWARIKDVPKDLDGKGFVYSGDRPSRWKDSKDIWMHGYWKWDWSDNYVKIESIDTKKKEIITAPPYSRYPYTKGKRFYAFNILEELDSPGEWYLDRDSGILYFWPPSDADTADIYVSLLTEPVFRLENTEGVTIKGLTMEYSCGAGAEILGGTKNVFKNCTFRNLGTIAVSMGKITPNPGLIIYDNTLYNGNAGTNNGVSDCEIYNMGEGGVFLGGGDRKTLTPGLNYVENTKIYKVSQWVRTYRSAVLMYGVGNIVRNCEIFELPHTAIFFWGNDQTVEYNHIYNVCIETADAGAIYNGRDWSQRGNLIRYNYIHDLRGVKITGHFNDVMGVYLDDFSSGTTIFGNIFYKAGRNILIGGGRENVVENNIFIDGEPAVHIDARGKGWASYYFNESHNLLFDRLKAVNPGEPPYSEKYPSLKTIPDDEPASAKYNCVEKNVFCGGRWRDLKNGLNDSTVCFKDNVVREECKFITPGKNTVKIDYEKGDFPKGFKKIPVDKIGVEN